SGNDHHVTQPVASQRPTYGIMPKGGRRNLLTHTEDFSNSDWVKDKANLVSVTNGWSKLAFLSVSGGRQSAAYYNTSFGTPDYAEGEALYLSGRFRLVDSTSIGFSGRR